MSVRIWVVCIVGTLLCPVLLWKKEAHFARLHENRELSAFPSALSFRFFSDLDGYINDHFGFRQTTIKLSRWLLVGVFHESTSPLVVLGRNQWLFFTDNEGGESRTTLIDSLGQLRFGDSELKRISGILNGWRSDLAKRNIRFVLAIAPNKQSIYREQLIGIPTKEPETRADQLIGFLAQNSRVDVFDLRQPLRAYRRNSDEFPLFWKLDSHWNAVGGYLAAEALSFHLRDLPPHGSSTEIAPPIGHFAYGGHVGDGDLATNLLAAQELFGERDVTVAITKGNGVHVIDGYNPFHDSREDAFAAFKSLNPSGRLLFCGDSFGNAMRLRLAADFSQSVFKWDYNCDISAINEFRPTTVVLEVVERRLSRLLDLRAIDLN